jgi:hypothetical protein
MCVCSCDTMGTFASLVWLSSTGAVVSGTLAGVVDMGTLGGVAEVGTLGGVTVCMGNLGGVALILLKSSASLLTAAIVALWHWRHRGMGQDVVGFVGFLSGLLRQ